MSIRSDGPTIRLDSSNYPTTQAFRWISNVRGYEDLDVVGKNKRATQRPPESDHGKLGNLTSPPVEGAQPPRALFRFRTIWRLPRQFCGGTNRFHLKMDDCLGIHFFIASTILVQNLRVARNNLDR
jgi:hypothetical protein